MYIRMKSSYWWILRDCFQVGSKIGVGKESDIYLAQTESGEEVSVSIVVLVPIRSVVQESDCQKMRPAGLPTTIVLGAYHIHPSQLDICALVRVASIYAYRWYSSSIVWVAHLSVP